MASPQLEDGFARVANEVLSALARTHWLKARHYRVVLAMWRHTYGHKGSPRVWKTSVSGLSTATGMTWRNAKKALDELVEMLILKVIHKGNFILIEYQKDHDLWRPGSTPRGQKPRSAPWGQNQFGPQGADPVRPPGDRAFLDPQGAEHKREDSLKEASKEREGATRLEGSLPLSSEKTGNPEGNRNGKLSTGAHMDAHVTTWRLWTIKQYVRTHGKTAAR